VDDVYNLVEFFLRPESRMITGQVVYLGGIS
jgi:3-oxoacyl-[acyl-carrier protein] reductase